MGWLSSIFGSNKTETVVQVQQTATQNQETNVGASKELNDIVQGLISVLKDQANNPTNVSSPIVIPVTSIESSTQQPEQYNNAAVSQLLASMYYNVYKGQQQVVDPKNSPFDMTSIFIAAAIVIIAVFIMRRK